jgi:predicted dehydrogenase
MPSNPAGRLMVVNPGHFHASLLQGEMYPSLANRVSVYAPLGPEVLDYLNRVSVFNNRKANPTHWELDVHCSPDPMSEMLRDRPGNIVVFTGRNRGKIDRILQSLEAGLHVFADKPWIITSADMPKLERALGLAEQKHLTAYDIMTERYEATTILQRALVSDPEIFGEPVSIWAKSVHHVMKIIGGVPLRRPAWFFDTAEYGEGLADVGTHVVDLVQWTAFADQMIDYRRDVQMVSGRHWPLTLTREQFQTVTGGADFPGTGTFDYFCNNAIEYKLGGVPVKLEILWNWEAAPGTGDVYEATFEGTRSRVELRQGAADGYVSEVYVVPSAPKVAEAVRQRVSEMAGLRIKEKGGEIHITIPAALRVGHEAHFAQVANRFFEYFNAGGAMPAWENPNMLAKYFVSTKGVELAS